MNDRKIEFVIIKAMLTTNRANFPTDRNNATDEKL
jgi:hypothetical protein